MSSGKGKSSRILTVEGLRGFAAATVVTYHIYMMGLTTKLVNPVSGVVAPFMEQLGHYAVALFFCISGFLIVQSLIMHGDWRVFARNRAARIYPVFTILHLIIFILGPIAGYEWMASLKHHPLQYVEAFVSNYLFLPGVFKGFPIAQKNAWSLSYEAVFYVLACVIFVGVQSSGQKKITGWLALLIGVVAAVAALAIRWDFWFFAVGVTCFWLVRKNRMNWSAPGPVGALCLILGFLTFRYSTLLSVLFVFPFFTSAVTESGWFSWFLRRPVLLYLGKISYSLYLSSAFVMEFLRLLCSKLAHKTGPQPAFILFAILSIIATPLVATLSYEYVERRLTQKLFPRREKNISTAEPALPATA